MSRPAAAVLASAYIIIAIVLLPSTVRAAVPNVDFENLPVSPLFAPDGFTVEACDGEAPLLCTEEDGQQQGLVEHLTFTLESFTDLAADLAAGTPRHVALVNEIGRYRTAVRTDRETVCPAHVFVADPTVAAAVAGTEGVRYGYTILVDGRLVERTVGFMTIRQTDTDDMVSILSATEINEGACIDSQGTLPFTDGGLGRFTPTFAGIAARADLGPGSHPFDRLTADVDLGAQDAVASAIAWSTLTLADGSVDTVLLARDDEFADALASGTAQGVANAPLLLTGSASLDARVRSEITRLGATTVVLLGGEQALGPAVADDLRGAGIDVTRLAGPDRVATAIAIADAYAPVTERVVLARADGDPTEPSQAFADALAAGALAADDGVPLLLTSGGALDERVADWLGDRSVEEVVVVGGPSALAPPVLQRLVEEGYGLRVLDGSDRAETAALVATTRLLPDAAHADAVVLVDDGTWSDGLVAASTAHRLRAPVLLTHGDGLPPATAAALSTADPAQLPLVVCGPSVTDMACQQARDLIRGR